MRPLLLTLLLALTASAGELTLSPAAAAKIGQRIWKNECAGTVSGLTSWNAGEDFPSLGIGHFIWYPKGTTGPFEESFPALLAFLRASGQPLPAWLEKTPHSPWATRAAFLADLKGERLASLRDLLSRTVPAQTAFMAARARSALPKLLSFAPKAQRPLLTQKYDAVATTPQGVYALMDYVNFKGEGTKDTERYQGQGWGLLQVLQEMKPVAAGQGAAAEFSAAAKRVLNRRISLAPRKETQWREGWLSRCDSYARPF